MKRNNIHHTLLEPRKRLLNLIICIIFITAIYQVSSASTQSFGKSDTNAPMIRLQSYNINTPGYFDETIVYFDSNATKGYNPNYDAFKLLNTYQYLPNIYSLEGTTKFAIKALPLLKDTAVTIPLGFNASVKGSYEIVATEIKNLPLNTDVYLTDNVTNKTQNLITDPKYSFSFDPGTADGRFTMKFSPVSIVTGFTNKSNSLNCNIYANGDKLKVTYTNTGNDQAILWIFNISGQNVIEPVKIKDGNYQLNLNNGIYIIKLLTNNSVYTKKIYIKN